MTKGTKAFRIAIGILLALTMLWSAFWGLVLLAIGQRMLWTSEYDIWVAGVSVTRSNKSDILGDGTVSYHAGTNTLTFDNAVIECDTAIVQSKVDLKINLIGENKFVCKNGENIPAIYAADSYLYKDIAFFGDGSLTIEMQNVTPQAQGVLAKDLTIASKLSITMPESADMVGGIICSGTLILTQTANVTVQNGAAGYNAAVRVYGNALMEAGAVLNASAKSNAGDTCKGLSVNGDLIMGENAVVNVTIDDELAEIGECVRVTGLLEVGAGAALTASAKKTYAVECYGAIKVNEGAVVSAESAGAEKDILCYGALVQYAATVNADTEALGGIHSKAQG